MTVSMPAVQSSERVEPAQLRAGNLAAEGKLTFDERLISNAPK
jgi:hypothetical protein